MKLYCVKVGKLDAYIRPHFANSVIYTDACVESQLTGVCGLKGYHITKYVEFNVLLLKLCMLLYHHNYVRIASIFPTSLLIIQFIHIYDST